MSLLRLKSREIPFLSLQVTTTLTAFTRHTTFKRLPPNIQLQKRYFGCKVTLFLK